MVKQKLTDYESDMLASQVTIVTLLAALILFIVWTIGISFILFLIENVILEIISSVVLTIFFMYKLTKLQKEFHEVMAL